MSLLLEAVDSGDVLDTIDLSGDGVLVYDTGDAEEIFEGVRRRTKVSDAELYRLMNPWSNGYLRVREEGPETAAVQVHLFTCREGGSKTGKVLHPGPCKGWKHALPKDDPRHPSNRPTPKTRTKKASAPRKQDPPSGTAEAQISDAYSGLAKEPGDFVSLANLRDALPDLSREEQDAALTRMAMAGDMDFIPEENQKVIDERDRAAALTLGGEPKHWVATPLNSESGARARQSRLDAVRAPGRMAAEVLERAGNEDSLEAIKRSALADHNRNVASFGDDSPAAAASRDLLAAVNGASSATDAREAVRAASHKLGFDLKGRVGTRMPFDPKQFDGVSSKPRQGQRVEVLRPAVLSPDGLLLEKGVVDTVSTIAAQAGVHLFTCTLTDEWHRGKCRDRSKAGWDKGLKGAPGKKGAEKVKDSAKTAVPKKAAASKTAKGTKKAATPTAVPSHEAVAKAFTPQAMRDRQAALEKEYEGRTVGDVFDLDTAAREETLRGIFEGDYGGFKAKDVKIDRRSKDWFSVEGRFYTAEGKYAGDFSREFVRNDDGSITVRHDYLTLAPIYQGQGLAERFNGKMFGWYRGSRVRDAELHANIDVGPYAWARAGWDLRAEKDAAKVSGWLREKADTYPDKAQARAAQKMADRLDKEKFGSPTYPTAYEISQLGRQPGQGKDDSWIGKDALLGKGHEYDAVMNFEYD